MNEHNEIKTNIFTMVILYKYFTHCPLVLKYKTENKPPHCKEITSLTYILQALDPRVSMVTSFSFMSKDTAGCKLRIQA